MEGGCRAAYTPIRIFVHIALRETTENITKKPDNGGQQGAGSEIYDEHRIVFS